MYWFDLLKDDVKTHFLSSNVDDFPDIGVDKSYLDGRSMLVKKAKVIPIECIVRGYISGSAWNEYLRSKSVTGISLVEGLKESDKFESTLFTPSTKATDGHDENISVDRMVEIVGSDLTKKLEKLSLGIYEKAAAKAREKGIIVADTKFEFGIIDEEIILIDEVLTPDSSRFWPVDEYRSGRSQPSFDKQFVRDYLDSIGWDRKPPIPELPVEIVKNTTKKYIEAYELITGDKFEPRGS